MKLLNCYISSFGNLKDFSYEFDGKLNTVKEENGWGKSTFASFIKSMFYGLDDAKRTVEDNERKRFTPWNSTDKFGGSLTFEWGGKPYKVERFFGAKTSDDTVKLYDINSGKTYTEGAAVENLGKRIFSIDEEGFLSTTYFSQKDFEIKSNSSITSKFNEVSEISDAYAFDRAIRTLDDKIKELKARGDKGRIADLKRQITAVNDEEERIKRSVQALDGLKKDFETLESESAVLDENIKDLTVKLQAAGKREAVSERKRRYDTVNAELIDLKSQVAAAEKTLNGKPLLKEQISDCEKCLRDLYEISAKSAALKDDIADIKGEYSPKKAGKPFTGKGSRLLITVQIISVLFILAGILITVGGFMWGLAFLGSGVIFGVLSVIKRDNRELAELYGRKERELAELEESKMRLTEGLDGFFAGFVFTDAELLYEQKLGELKMALKTREECAAKTVKAQAEMKELETAGIDSGADGTESVSELNAELKTATEWYKSKASETERIKMRINALETATDNLFDTENKKARLKEELSESEKQLKILTLTAEFLKSADETLKIRYRAPLQESLNKYVKMIAGREIAASIDTDLKISVNITGAERETEYFSKGYRNLFEICKRFALTDILFTGEKPFIILDDPFSDLDDEKVAAAVDLIKRLSEEYQILYFICHESRRA